jgi:hypothetical protein
MGFFDDLKRELEKKLNQGQGAIRGAVEKINPFDEQSKQDRASKELTDFTGRSYGFTDEMKNQLAQNFVTVGEGAWQTGNGWLKEGVRSGGQFSPMASEIKVADQDGMGGASTLRHEALHSIWQSMDDQDRSKFVDLVKTTGQQDPDLMQFLESRMEGYKDGGNINEIHSFIPEYYEYDIDNSKRAYEDGTMGLDRRMSGKLREYYEQFYNPSKRRERDDIAKEIMQMTGAARYRF